MPWNVILYCHENGTVAQSVEQRTFNPLVASSNLARPTIFSGYALITSSRVRTEAMAYTPTFTFQYVATKLIL
jgi:hypothetical protein